MSVGVPRRREPHLAGMAPHPALSPPSTCAHAQEKLQGPHPLCQLQSWMSFLAASAVGNAEHQLAYARFSGVSVCKVGYSLRGWENGSGVLGEGTLGAV